MVYDTFLLKTFFSGKAHGVLRDEAQKYGSNFFHQLFWEKWFAKNISEDGIPFVAAVLLFLFATA